MYLKRERPEMNDFERNKNIWLLINLEKNLNFLIFSIHEYITAINYQIITWSEHQYQIEEMANPKVKPDHGKSDLPKIYIIDQNLPFNLLKKG